MRNMWRSIVKKVSHPFSSYMHGYSYLPDEPFAQINCDGLVQCMIALNDDIHIAVGFVNNNIEIYNIITQRLVKYNYMSEIWFD